MGGKRIIEASVLVQLATEFFNTECKGNVSMLTYTAIARFISKQTGMDIQEHVVRRCPEIVNYVKSKNEDSENDELRDLVVYQTLDIDSFMSKNNSLQSLKTALLQRDQYYEKICSQTVKVVEHAKALKKENAALSEERNKLQAETLELNAKYKQEHKEKVCLEKAFKKMKDILYDNVYPNIADELLKENGLIQGDGSIITISAKENILSDDSSITKAVKNDKKKYSNLEVIQGLFNKI
jgi:hypothetical protein